MIFKFKYKLHKKQIKQEKLDIRNIEKGGIDYTSLYD